MRAHKQPNLSSAGPSYHDGPQSTSSQPVLSSLKADIISAIESKISALSDSLQAPIATRKPQSLEDPLKRSGKYWMYNLLAEMAWMHKEFTLESKWKREQYKKLSKEGLKGHAALEKKRASVDSDETRLQKIAFSLARDIDRFWKGVSEVVAHRRKERKSLKIAQDKQRKLGVLMDRTERFAVKVAKEFEGSVPSTPSAFKSVPSTPLNISPALSPSDSEADLPSEPSEDDESSLDREEAGRGRAKLRKEEKMESNQLLQDADRPIEDILRELQEAGEAEEDDDGEESDPEMDSDEYSLSDDNDEDEEEESGQEGEGDFCESSDTLNDPSNSAPPTPPTPQSSSDALPVVPRSTRGRSKVDALALPTVAPPTVAPPTVAPPHTLESMTEEMASAQPTGNTLQTSRVNTPVPFLLRASMREYQHIGLDWLATLHDKKFNGILADEMGLGKTLQTIALLAHLACSHGIWGPHLVVVPTSVLLNWELEFKRFFPGCKVLCYFGSQKERSLKRIGWTKDNTFHVVLVSYATVLQDAAMFRRKKWYYMILDEAQHIKNFKSQRWQTLLTFHTERRLLLTGTPLQNDLMEMWSLLHFLMPSVFSSHSEFKDWFSDPLSGAIERREVGKHSELIERLHGVLRPFLLRRLKKDVEKQMPSKFEHVLRAPLSQRQRILYEEFLHLRDTKESLKEGNFLGLMNVLMQLRKVCNHPDLFESRGVATPLVMHKSTVNMEIPAVIANLLESVNQPGISGKGRVLDFWTGIDHSFKNSFFNGSVLAQLCLAHSELSGVSILDSNMHLEISSDWTISGREGVPKWRSSLDFLNSHSSSVKNRSFCDYLADPLIAKEFNDFKIIGERNDKISRYDQLILGIQRANDCQPLFGPSCVKICRIPGKRNWGGTQVGWEGEWNSEGFLPGNFKLLFPTPAEIFDRDWPLLSKFRVSTVRVLACPPSINLSSNIGVLDRISTVLTPMSVSCASAPFYRMLTPLVFPDKRLLEWDCGKLRVLGPLLKRLRSENSKVILFTQMSRMLDILEIFINFHGFTYVRLDGATKVEKRQAVVDSFNKNSKIFIFLSSTRSGGVGINLTSANSVIFYDSDWNQAMDKQAVDRAHRIGQTRDVHIYRLISEGSVEENIWKKQLQKRELDELVVDGGAFNTQSLTGKKWSAADVAGILGMSSEDSIYGSSEVWKGRREDVDVERAMVMVEDGEDRQALQAALKEDNASGDKVENDSPRDNAWERLPAIVKFGVNFLDNELPSDPESDIDDEDDVEVEMSGWESEDEQDDDESQPIKRQRLN